MAVALVVAGCGPGARQDTKTRLVLAMWGSAAEETQMRRWVAQFEQANPGVGVEVVNPAQTYTEKVLTMCAGGTPPDVLMVGTAGFGFTYAYAEKGILLPLDDLVTEDMRRDVLPAAWGGVSWKGKVYAFPREVNPFVLYYNRDLFDKAGLKYPDETWTWETLIENAARLTQETNGRVTQYGLTEFPWQAATLSYGGRFVDETERFVAGAEGDQATRKAVALLLEARRRKAIPDTVGGETAFGDSWTAILSGRVAMWISGPWDCRELAVMKPKFRWDMALTPKGSQRASMLYTVGYAVHAGTRHRDAAVALARFLVSPVILKEFATSGRAFPSSKSAYESAYLSDEGFRMVENKTAPFKMLEFSRDELVTPQHGQLLEVMRRNVEQIFLCKTDADSGLTRMNSECNAVLKDGRRGGRSP
jgi:multiple sugar transport system substrate-binding protein